MAIAKKLHVHTNDQVVVISGKDKGKKGKVLSAHPSTGRVVVEGVAIVSRHQKPRRQGEPGGIIHREAAIDASNVMLVCPKCNKPARMGKTFTDANIKVRVCKKCQATLDD